MTNRRKWMLAVGAGVGAAFGLGWLSRMAVERRGASFVHHQEGVCSFCGRSPPEAVLLGVSGRRQRICSEDVELVLFIVEHFEEEPSGDTPPSGTVHHCDFCDATERDGRRLIGGGMDRPDGATNICDVCAKAAQTLIDAGSQV